jgi:photosystem II stability/assembly factor-like uncharacterized protein
MTVYAAFDDAVLRVEDGDTQRFPVEGSVRCVAADGDELLVGTFGEGLERRTADGFVTVLDGSVTAIARNHHDGSWLAGTEPSAVYRSEDGREWTAFPDLTDLPSSAEWSFPPRPDTHHVRWIDADATQRGRWYVAIEAGALVRTDDAGDTWRDRPEGARRDNHEVHTHADDPGRVYVAAGDGYAESFDGGDSWTYPQEGLDERYCWSLAVDPADPDTHVVASARSASQAHRQGRSSVYRRTGEDEEWSVVDDLPHGDGAYRALVTATEGGTFHALSNHGLFLSEDAGDSWTRVVPVPEEYAQAPPRGLTVV